MGRGREHQHLEAVRQSDLILIGVSLPGPGPDRGNQARAFASQNAGLFAASVKNARHRRCSGHGNSVVRAMPNTPSALGAGMAALCRGRFVSKEQMNWRSAYLRRWAATVLVDEKHMDAVTGCRAPARRIFTSSLKRWQKPA